MTLNGKVSGMYKVMMVKASGAIVKVLGFADSTKEADELIGMACRQFGCEWIGSHGYDFNVKEA